MKYQTICFGPLKSHIVAPIIKNNISKYEKILFDFNSYVKKTNFRSERMSPITMAFAK